MASTSWSTPSPVRAETGKYSARSRLAARVSWASTCVRSATSTLLTTQIADLGTRLATNRSPLPRGAVASMTRQTTSTPSDAEAAVAFSRSPIVVLGLWMPGVSTNTTWASSLVNTPRISVRVVWGDLATMLTFSPRMALSRVDLPTLGRPTSVANPDFTRGRLSFSIRHRFELADAHPADAPALHPLGPQAAAVVVDCLPLGGHVPEQEVDEPADGVVVALGELGVEQLVELVDGHAGIDPHVAAGKGLDRRLLHVVLVDDLAHQLLDEILEGDQAGGAAVLVDHDGHVALLLLHLRQQLGHPLGLGHEVGRPGQLADLHVAPLVPNGPHEVLGVEQAVDVVDPLLVDRYSAEPRGHDDLHGVVDAGPGLDGH